MFVMLPRNDEQKSRWSSWCLDVDKTAQISPDIQGDDGMRSVYACYAGFVQQENVVLIVDRPQEVALALRAVTHARVAVLADVRMMQWGMFNTFIVHADSASEIAKECLVRIAQLGFNEESICERDIAREWMKQQHSFNLIASESLSSDSIRRIQGSILTNKYAEGYPGKRYYGGCGIVDDLEVYAQEQCKQLFGCAYANVQPHSGSQANQAVYAALLKPGDTILGMSLAHGGHLTHGHKANLSGKVYQGVAYGVKKDTGFIDYEQVEMLAQEHKPSMIIAGASAYSREIDYACFQRIAKSVGAYLLVDMAHIAGFVAAGLLPSPLPYADVVTSTTHKTLNGPRGGLIISNNADVFETVCKGVFPYVQGGPLMHVIAAKAQAFCSAQTPAYKSLMKRAQKGAQVMAGVFMEKGFDVLTQGTDNHKILIDLRAKGVTGTQADDRLAEHAVFANKNMVPFDTATPMNPSGLRLGSMSLACRGMDSNVFREVATMLAEIVASEQEMTAHKKRIQELCALYPIMYSGKDISE